MRTLTFRLRKNKSGSIAVPAALTGLALVVGFGAAADYSRVNGLRTSLEGALDSATLAAAIRLSSEILSDNETQDIVAKQLAANLTLNEPGTSVKTLDVVIDKEAGVISTTAVADLELAFAGVLGLESVEVDAKASATFGSKTVELALVLDVTGSMEGQRLADLKTAAKGLVDELLPADGSMDDKVRISVVPFAQAVNVGAYRPQVMENTGGYWAYSKKKGHYFVAYNNSCATERNTDPFTDAGPIGNKLRGDASACPASTVMPLSNDRTAIRAHIDSFVASGGTAGHLGVAWGWYTISPQWTDIWPDASDPTSYEDDETLKFIVFMTDGDFNTWYTSGNGDSKAQALAVCSEAKNSKVTLFTVGFQISSSAATMMRQCATSENTFFQTTSGSQLVNAFKAIANAVNTIYLTH